jgi:ribosomal protein S18 acetylase RimI-like enzyme
MDAPSLMPATAFSYADLARLLNQAYADYYVTIQLNPYQFERMCIDMDVDLAGSLVARADDQLVGLSLLSVRASEGWVSGVGVRPKWRRRGIARSMIQALQALARERDLARVRLEVLAQNRSAIALYESEGYTAYRDLLVLRLAPMQMATPPSWAGLLSVRPASLLEMYDTLHEVPPSWQCALPTLRKRTDHLHGLAAYEDSRLVAYVLYQPQHDACGVFDVAVDPSHPSRLALANRLLYAVHASQPTLGGFVINLPAQDPLLPAFFDLGYYVWQRQHEMVLAI